MRSSARGFEQIDGQRGRLRAGGREFRDQVGERLVRAGQRAAEKLDPARPPVRWPARFPDEAPVTTIAGFEALLVCFAMDIIPY